MAKLNENNWLREISSFRQDPAKYLSRNHLKNEEFSIDLLQVLYNDGLSVSAKYNILLLLQDHTNILLPSDTSVEQVVSSLQDVFTQSANSASLKMFRGQILVSITSVIIQKNVKDTLLSLVTAFIELLLEIIRHVNRVTDTFLRGRACVCLAELELTYPCLLMGKLEHISQLSAMEKTHVSHYYVHLFSLTLNHVTAKMAASTSSLSSNSLDELLSHRTQPLLPFIMPEDVPQTLNVDEGKTLPPHLSTVELNKVVSLVAKQIKFGSPQMVTMVTNHIGAILQRRGCSDNSVMTGLLGQYTSTFDPCLLHAVISQYQSLVMRDEQLCDEDTLLMHCVNYINNSRLLLQQRLLVIQWLQGLVIERLPRLSSALLSAITPCIFDPPLLQAQKIQLLSLVFSKCTDKSDIGGQVITSCLKLMELEAMLADDKSAVWSVLFRTVFRMYLTHEKTHLINMLHRHIVELSKSDQRLIPYILDLTKQVKLSVKDSAIDNGVTLPLLENVMTHSSPQMSSEVIKYHTSIITSAAHLPNLPAEAVLGYLLALIKGLDDRTRSDWEVGSSLLVVCKHLLQYHNHNHTVSALGEVLHQMTLTFSDLDIKNRATFYYTLLTSLSAKKILSILAQSNGDHKGKTLVSIMKGEGYFTAPPQIITSQQPLLALNRLKEIPLRQIPTLWSSDDILKEYYDFLASESCTKHITVTCDVSLEADMAEAFAVVMEFDAGNNYHSLQKKYIPHIQKGAPVQVGLCARPKTPLPVIINICACLTGPNNASYRCVVDPLPLTFIDLWQPLAWPKSFTVKQQESLFNLMWEKLSDGPSGLESILSIDSCEDCQPSSLPSELKPFTLNSSCEDEDSSTNTDINCDYTRDTQLAVYLPPSSHLLCTLTFTSRRVVVKIATDTPTVLPLTSALLTQLFSS